MTQASRERTEKSEGFEMLFATEKVIAKKAQLVNVLIKFKRTFVF